MAVDVSLGVVAPAGDAVDLWDTMDSPDGAEGREAAYVVGATYLCWAVDPEWANVAGIGIAAVVVSNVGAC